MNSRIPPTDEPRIGEAWGDFRLIERLGQGACAEAWLALRTGRAGFAKLVVLKLLRDRISPDLAQVTFEREALALSRMNHPNVVQVLDVVEQHQRRAFVMEYIEGKTVGQLGWPSAPGTLTLSIGLRLLHDLLLGLDHVHNVRDHDGSHLCIVHGDVSPNNVLLTYTGQAKLIDFGVAQHRGAMESAGGTLRYMAPERLLGDSLSPAADIYGVGAMMWELLARRPLYAGMGRERMRAASLAGIVNRPLQQRETGGEEAGSDPAADRWLPELERMCLRALAYFPKDRYTSSAEFAEQLALAPLATHAETQAFLQRVHGADREARRKQVALRVTQLGRLPEPAPSPTPRSDLITRVRLGLASKRMRREPYWPMIGLGLLSLSAYAMLTTSSEPTASWASEHGQSTSSPPQTPLKTSSTEPPETRPAVRAPAPIHFSAAAAPPQLTAREALKPAEGGRSEPRAAHHLASGSEAHANRGARHRTGGPSERAPRPATQQHPAAQQRPAVQAASHSLGCSPRYYYKDGVKYFKAACFR